MKIISDLPYLPPAAVRRWQRLLLAVSAGTLASCASTAAQDLTFRVRSDMDAPLNANEGWAAEQGESVTVEADRPFRLRMEAASRNAADSYALQVRRNNGAWEKVEAQDFPYPKRELKLTFKDQPAGSPPESWSMPSGGSEALIVVADGHDHLLRVSGGERGAQAVYPAPWPLPEFSFSVRFRLPAAGGEGFAMLVGYIDPANHALVRFHPVQGVELVRVSDGREVVVSWQAANITPNTWHEAEVELENGHLAVELDDGALQFAALLALAPGELGIAVPIGGQVDLAELSIEGVASTPRVSIVSAPYANGEATTDLLSGSALPFAPAFGLSLREATPSWQDAGRHGEFEWPLVIRRFADGPQVNETGDRFEFRMVGKSEGDVPVGTTASVDLMVPPAHLGGTFVETPGRIGPWQASNGDLYFIMEPTETDNKFMMVKSSDGGRSWREVDGANRPATNDLESVDSRLVSDRIHIVHQVTRSVRYHVFRTSDHPTHPDTWELRDEVAARADAIAQTATMAVRPDGSIVTFFLGDRVHYAVRDSQGRWSAPVEIDPQAGFINAGPQAVAGRDGVVHLAYFSDDGRIWYCRLLSDGTLTARQHLAEGAGTTRAEYGSVLPLAYDPVSDTVSIIYRLADGTLHERRVRGDAAPTKPVRVSDRAVITDAVDSQQAAADVVSDGAARHVLFIDEDTRSLFSTRSDDGAWQMPVPQVRGIKGSWVRGNLIKKPGGSRVYGFVYDAGSEGGAGLNRYAEIPLTSE